MARNIAAGIILAGTSTTFSCAIDPGKVPDAANQAEHTTWTSGLYGTNNIPVVPHRVEEVTKAVSQYGDYMLNNPETQGSIIVNGGVGKDCITTVNVDVSKSSAGVREVSFTPGVSTALEDLDSENMGLSVHLDVDTGQNIPQPTISASQINDRTTAQEAANDLLSTAKLGCDIYERDIVPHLGP